MSDFNFQPRLSAQVARQPRVVAVKYGDGYEQRVADGLNTLPQAWQLEFTNTKATIDIIEAQLAGYGGVTSFTWTPSGYAEIRVVCRQWTRTILTRDVHTLTGTFEQVFE